MNKQNLICFPPKFKRTFHTCKFSQLQPKHTSVRPRKFLRNSVRSSRCIEYSRIEIDPSEARCISHVKVRNNDEITSSSSSSQFTLEFTRSPPRARECIVESRAFTPQFNCRTLAGFIFRFEAAVAADFTPASISAVRSNT